MKIPGQYQHFTLCSMPIVCDDISNKVLPSQSGWWHRVKGIGDPADHQLQPISVTGALFASLWFIYKRNCLLIMGLLHLNSLPPSLPYSLPLPPPSPLSLSLSVTSTIVGLHLAFHCLVLSLPYPVLLSLLHLTLPALLFSTDFIALKPGKQCSGKDFHVGGS